MLVIIGLHMNLVVLFEKLGKTTTLSNKKTDLVILDNKFALCFDLVNLDRLLDVLLSR